MSSNDVDLLDSETQGDIGHLLNAELSFPGSNSSNNTLVDGSDIHDDFQTNKRLSGFSGDVQQ